MNTMLHHQHGISVAVAEYVPPNKMSQAESKERSMAVYASYNQLQK